MAKRTVTHHPSPNQNWGRIGKAKVSAEPDDVRAYANKVLEAEAEATKARSAWIRAEMEREAEI